MFKYVLVNICICVLKMAGNIAMLMLEKKLNDMFYNFDEFMSS